MEIGWIFKLFLILLYSYVDDDINSAYILGDLFNRSI